MEEIIEVNRLTPQGHLVRGVRNRLLKYPRFQVKTEHRTVEEMFDAPVANLVPQQRMWDRCAESPLQVPKLFKSRPLVPQERISDRFVVRNMDNHVPQNVDEIARDPSGISTKHSGGYC